MNVILPSCTAPPEPEKSEKQLELEFKIRHLLTRPDAIPAIADLLFPGVAGYTDVKFGMMCMLVNQWDSDTRDRIHVLLYGKPGTGKTMLMEPLERNYNALYISMDATAASLRGDARKDDHGAKIFNECHGGIICMDDIEKMKDQDVLRDVMESGRYTVTKGGEHVEYEGECRIVAATNDITKMPVPVRSRFDLVFKYDFPTIQQAMGIVEQLLNRRESLVNYDPLLSHYIEMAKAHEPEIVEKAKISTLFEEYFKENGHPTDAGEPGGKEGRWIVGIFRLAKAIARLNLGTLGPDQIAQALAMKKQCDEVLRSIA